MRVCLDWYKRRLLEETRSLSGYGAGPGHSRGRRPHPPLYCVALGGAAWRAKYPGGARHTRVLQVALPEVANPVSCVLDDFN